MVKRWYMCVCVWPVNAPISCGHRCEFMTTVWQRMRILRGSTANIDTKSPTKVLGNCAEWDCNKERCAQTGGNIVFEWVKWNGCKSKHQHEHQCYRYHNPMGWDDMTRKQYYLCTSTFIRLCPRSKLIMRHMNRTSNTPDHVTTHWFVVDVLVDGNSKSCITLAKLRTSC